MELILKLPKAKEPFIGIKFENKREAETLNMDLVENKHKWRFDITLEPTKNGINLNLTSQNPALIRFYRDLKYDPQKLQNWLYYAKEFNQFKFSHLIQVFDEEKVVMTQPNMLLFILRVGTVEVFGIN